MSMSKLYSCFHQLIVSTVLPPLDPKAVHKTCSVSNERPVAFLLLLLRHNHTSVPSLSRPFCNSSLTIPNTTPHSLLPTWPPPCTPLTTHTHHNTHNSEPTVQVRHKSIISSSSENMLVRICLPRLEKRRTERMEQPLRWDVKDQDCPFLPKGEDSSRLRLTWREREVEAGRQADGSIASHTQIALASWRSSSPDPPPSCASSPPLVSPSQPSRPPSLSPALFAAFFSSFSASFASFAALFSASFCLLQFIKLALPRFE